MASDEPAESLAGLGEFAVIDRLVAGRDAAAGRRRSGPATTPRWSIAADGRTVVSTDMLVEGRHFRLDWSTPHDVGRKAIAQNAADIEAMGAAATAFVVAFGAPGDTPADDALALSDGMWQEAGAIGAGIVGGDLVGAPQWVISVTALGDLGGRAPVLLGGARPGDAVAVVGRPRSVGRRICVVAQRDSTASTSCAAGIWSRSRPTGRAGRGRRGRDGDDRRLRRPARRPRSRRRRVRRRHRRVDGGAGGRPRRRAPRPPPRRTPIRGRGCSAAGRTTRWSRRSPARRPPGWRRDRHGASTGRARVLVDGADVGR